ncbi:MAG: PEP-CTERM sorting domain-containing protein [Geminicoccaceae bacterium]
MRFALFGLLAVLAFPAHAITFQFETIEQDDEVNAFDVTLRLSEERPFRAEANRFADLDPIIDVSPSFLSLDLFYSFGSESTELTLTPTDFASTSLDFNDLIMTESFFFHTGEFAQFTGVSSGGLTDLWEITFISDEIFLVPLTLTGRFVTVPEPQVLGMLVIGLFFIGRLKRRK